MPFPKTPLPKTTKPSIPPTKPLTEHQQKQFQQLQSFITIIPAVGTPRNRWLIWGPYEVYLRHVLRPLPNPTTKETNTMFRCLDIANITNNVAKQQGKGLMWEFIQYLDNNCSNQVEALYIENVINARLRDSLRMRHWQEIKSTVPPSFVHWRS